VIIYCKLSNVSVTLILSPNPNRDMEQSTCTSTLDPDYKVTGQFADKPT